jgi:uncharacterized membrane protein
VSDFPPGRTPEAPAPEPAPDAEPEAQPDEVPEDAPEPPADAGAAREAGAASGEHLVAILFDKPGRANEVFVNLLNLVHEGAIRLGDAVIVVKDDLGVARIHQTVDVTPGKGALVGTWWGLLAGLFLGPLAIAGGAAAGALYGKLVDRGLDDGWVKQMSQWLEPGTSALLLLVAIENEETVVRELGRYEGRIVVTDFPEAVRRELEAALEEG